MNSIFNIDLGPPNNDENDGKQEESKKPKLEVTLSYLRTLEMFGSLEWFDGGKAIHIGSRGLFAIGNALCKEDVINIAIAGRITFIVEIIALERLPEEKTIVQLLPAYVIIDEEDVDE